MVCRSRLKITCELTRFIEVENHEAVKIGDLEKNSEAIKVVKPKYSKEIFQNAAIREGVDELTLREGEGGTLRSFINAATVGGSRWRLPLVDEDWHAICQTIHKGVEGAEWEILYFKLVEMNQEVNVRHPMGSSRAETLCKIRDASARCDAYNDQRATYRKLRRGSAETVEQTLAESGTGMC